MEYFDTAFLAKLYLNEPGSDSVRSAAADMDALACSVHGRVELAYVFHRKYREGAINRKGMMARLFLLEEDTAEGRIQWLPVGEALWKAAWESVTELRKKPPLRAADALHLVSASDNGFKRIYSNDRMLLGSAGHFGLQGINLISGK
jgi:predicted nucleic acid-binding protein